MKTVTIQHRHTCDALFAMEAADADPEPLRTAVICAAAGLSSSSGMRGASLAGAALHGAKLRHTNLGGVALRGADLSCADLRGASLRCGNLTNTSLVYADLTGADLTGADLTGADLTGAILVSTDLRTANLRAIREDVRAVLDTSPNEVDGLLLAVREGRIDGSTYKGRCACLVGTIANVRGCSVGDLGSLYPGRHGVAERWFLAIRPGHTPANSQISAITESWIVEWQSEHAATLSSEMP